MSANASHRRRADAEADRGGDELTRRCFLLSMISGVVVLGAGGCATLAAPSPPSTWGVPTTVKPNDVATMNFAAGLEVLAVGAYATIPGAAGTEGLGPVPRAIQGLIAIVAGHHQSYRDAWNHKLRERGKPEVTDPDPTFRSIIVGNLSRAGSIEDVGRVLASVEGVVAANCLSNVSQFNDPDLRQLAAAIHMAVMQHAAVLEFLIGGNPVPAAFASDEFSIR